MGHQVAEGGAGVEPARGWHQVEGSPAEGSGGEAGFRPSIDDRSPSGQPDEPDDTGPKPPHQTLDPSQAEGELVGGDLLGASRGPLHQIGHADGVVAQGRPTVAIDGDQPGRSRCRPETVPRARKAQSGVGGVEARVQAAHKHVQAGCDEVGKGPGPHRKPVFGRADPGARHRAEPATDEQIRVRDGGPSCRGELEASEGPDGESGVEISQRQRDATEPQRTESRPLGSPCRRFDDLRFHAAAR